MLGVAKPYYDHTISTLRYILMYIYRLGVANKINHTISTLHYILMYIYRLGVANKPNHTDEHNITFNVIHCHLHLHYQTITLHYHFDVHL